MPYQDEKKRVEFLKKWKQNNPEKVKEHSKTWKDKNKDKVMSSSMEYYWKHRERILLYQKRYARDPVNKAKTQKRHKAYRIKNKEIMSKKAKQYRLDNPKLFKAKSKERYQKNKEQFVKSNFQIVLRKIKRTSDYKKDKCCSECGYNEVTDILQFHHRDPKIKKSVVSKTRCQKTFDEEAKKCELLCPCCHFILHHKERTKANEIKKKKLGLI